jgi:hypothetical protein
MGFDLDLLPRHGSGVLLFDLVASTATIDGAPFDGQMLVWCRDLLHAEIARIDFDRTWLRSATVTLTWTWLGKDYALVSTADIETADSSATVTVEDTQPPLPPPLRANRHRP